MTKAHAIIAGGGTAGHVVPGLAIASELVARGVSPEQVHYVGSARGIETRLVPEAGFPLTVLPGRGIQRRLTLENVRSVFALLAAIVAGIRLVRRLRPAVVVGLGGYASVPCVIGAVLWRVPIVVTIDMSAEWDQQEPWIQANSIHVFLEGQSWAERI